MDVKPASGADFTVALASCGIRSGSIKQKGRDLCRDRSGEKYLHACRLRSAYDATAECNRSAVQLGAGSRAHRSSVGRCRSAFRLFPLFDRQVVSRVVTEINLAWPRDLLFLVQKHLFPLR